MSWFTRLFPFGWFLAAVLVFFVWQIVVFVGARPREYSAAETKALSMALSNAGDAMAGQLKGPVRIGVAHLVNDPGDRITTMLKEELASRPDWTVEQGSIIRRFLGDVSKAVADATRFEEVARAGRRVSLDVVVGGRVIAVEPEGDGAKAVLQVFAYDVRPAQWAVKETFSSSWTPGLVEKTVTKVQRTRPLLRFTIWLSFVLILPWATAFATHRTLEKKSNLSSFVLLALYIVLGMAAAVALSGFSAMGGAEWGRFLGAFVLCAGYSYWACEKIAEKN